MEKERYVCPRCGNNDERYIGYKNNVPYCRLCLSFQGQGVKEYFVSGLNSSIKLDYPLSKDQERISNEVISNYSHNISMLIYAVCGAGKTELCLGVMAKALEEKKHVGFAVPRREVVVDLAPRFIYAFPKNKVISVYGSHSEELEGDVIVLTTHQLYRYTNYFDLLIVDEIDAFPFKDNRLLLNLFYKSIRGVFIMMSATPPDDVVKYFKDNKLPILELHTRFHRHALPTPIIKIRIGYFKILFLVKKIKQYKNERKQVMIFAPTINKCMEVYNILKFLIKKGTYVHSKCEDRNQKISDFKNKKYDYLLTTSVLERGVTIKNVQVIIFDADNDMYQKGVLVQISGRVGRKIDAPTGEVIFLSNKKSLEMNKAIEAIKYDNSFL